MNQLFAKTICIASCLLIGATCSAEPSAEEWARVMNLSGRQRMLTQKMSKEALFVASNVNADDMRASLGKTTNLFETTLAGLRDGDASVGLPATENSRIVKQLDKVNGLYLELKPIFESIAQGGTPSPDQLSTIASKNVPLLKEMNKAVKMYERGAKKVLTGSADSAIVINLAGKQRMLTQKMTKEALLVHLSIDLDNNQLNLRETTSLFDRTLKGLMDGDSDLELPGTQDESVRGQLGTVSSTWTDLKPIFDGVLAGSPINESQLTTLADKNIALLKESNAAVKLFEQSAN